MSKSYRAPTGDFIVGTLDMVPATAFIGGISNDGKPEYDGGSKIHWDDQETVKRNGKIVYVDESGGEWTFDQLIPEQESDADE